MWFLELMCRYLGCSSAGTRSADVDNTGNVDDDSELHAIMCQSFALLPLPLSISFLYSLKSRFATLLNGLQAAEWCCFSGASNIMLLSEKSKSFEMALGFESTMF